MGDFGECGEMESCRMLLNDEGTCKGIAFIKYNTEEGCKKAIEFNETDYGGRTIYVSMAGEGGKGKGKKGKKGKPTSEAKAKSSGAMVESTGKKVAFDDSEDEEEAPPPKKKKKPVVEESDDDE